jgi:phage repressor protein C with HTH and peptisase S24 domain
MSAATTHRASLSLLQLESPGSEPVRAGVLLLDPVGNRLYARLRRDWESIAPGEAEVLELLEGDLAAKSAELGGTKLLAYLEESLSNTLTITDRREVIVEDFDRALGRFYRENVATVVRKYVSHLPRYSLAVAAGKFLENQEVTEEGWEEVPAGLRITPSMFVAHIRGRSMEPLIPDQSLCVFRGEVVGSRQGKLVLVESLGRGGNDRYTVKRYASKKSYAEDGTWAHEQIRLEALNPEFESWDLNPEEDRYRILAEFVCVLD